ncbi:MAG: hypothetical protein KDK99_00495 [Verrucomicrobiales bacterium]|nr:hypothetical protein [Verrucomicrobiales bacterium]
MEERLSKGWRLAVLLSSTVGMPWSAAGTAKAEEVQRIQLSGTPGAYAIADWKQDWPQCAFETVISEGRVERVDRDGHRWLSVRYPEGSHGSGLGGAVWRMPLPGADRMELRYTLQFEEGFDFNKGGKLPGLCGGPKTITGGDRVNGLEGFSVRLMWRKEGRGQAYVYHMDQPGKYGNEFDFPEAFRFPIGRDIAIRIEVTINRPGEKDGQIRVWTTLGNESEQLQLDQTGLRFRATPSYAIDGLLFNTFHGGSDASWAPRRDCRAQFGGFEVRR